jgi:hypothetical protein
MSNREPAAVTKLLTAAVVADRMGILPQSLRLRRHRGSGGPPWIRLSDSPTARVYYPAEEFEAWLAARPRFVSTGAERAAKAAGDAVKRGDA